MTSISFTGKPEKVNRDCIHGQLKRTCQLCDNEATIESLAARCKYLEEKLESKEQSLADANDQIERQRERYKELEKALHRAHILNDMARRDGAKLGWNLGICEDEGGYQKFQNDINEQIYDARRLAKVTPPEQSNETDS